MSESMVSGLFAREELAAGRYLAARKAMTGGGRELASLLQLVREQPTRQDYQQAYYQALATYNDAVARTDRAYERYVAAQVSTDARCTATTGRDKAAVAGVA